MRNLKKFLALVLAMVMAMSLMVTANAADKNATDVVYSDGAQVTTFKEAVDVLSGMKVFQGDENGFRPADTITRGEVAAIIYRLITGDVEGNRVPVYTGFGGFTDVTADEWFAPYVAYLANDQIIKGETNTTFNPYGSVTGYEALAMMLRAVGYDVNGEFTGPEWRTQVGAIATERGVLDEINATRYANLNNAATREVVAELLFKTAQIATVTYTPAYGYHTGAMTNANVDTRTLGWKNFGLICQTGVIHGNKATGESNTMVMFEGGTISYTPKAGATGEAKWDMYTHPNAIIATTDEVAKGNADYDVNDSGTIEAAERKIIVRAPGATAISRDTGLDQFGHMVKVWYNYNGWGAKTVYAMYDQVTQVRAVASTDANLGRDQALNAAASDFSINPAGAYFSDRFGTIGLNKVDIDNADNTLDGERVASMANPFFKGDNPDTADARNHTAQTADQYLYMLISNSGNKQLDVVVSLAVELADITEWDTTSTTRTLTIGEVNTVLDDGSVHSLFGHDYSSSDTGKGTSGNGELRWNSIVEGSATALGTKVTAWEVKGTNPNNKNLMNYQLNEIKKPISGTVAHYNRETGRVTLTDGTVLDFTILPVVDNAVEIMRGEDYKFNSSPYTFFRDEFGRYTHFTQDNGYQFLYGAYADYSVGALGSAKMDYVINGVDWDGNVKTLLPLKQINSQSVTGALYENLAIAKKNQGGANSDTADRGNEIMAGKYTGYGYSTTVNNLLTKNRAGDNGEAASGVNYANHNDYPFDAEYYYKNWLSTSTHDNNWNWTTADVANGFKDVSSVAGRGRLLITPTTKFILVSGLGVDGDLKTEIVTGLSGLLAGAGSVEIDIDADRDDDSVDYNVYYRTNADVYNNIDTTNSGNGENYMIHTVILPAAAVHRSNSSMFFTNKVTDNGIVLADHPQSTNIKNITMWQNGVKGNYWIDITAKDNPLTTASEAVGNFYNLISIDTHNGQTIYAAKALGDNTTPKQSDVTLQGVCNVNQTYTYFAANNTATGMIGTNIMNVANVGAVVDLDTVNGGEPAHTEIKSVRDINNAISVGYTVTVAIVNDGLNVSTIYVTNVTK